MKVSFCRFFFWQKVSSNDRLNRLIKGVAPTHYNDELHHDDVITIMIPAIQHFFHLSYIILTAANQWSGVCRSPRPEAW